MIELRAGAATDIGRVRTSNQDQLLVTAELFAVADGMGGHAAGEVASLTAIEALKAAYGHNAGTAALVEAARQANRSIWDRAQLEPGLRGMGTTLVAVALVEEEGEDRLAVVNVGDSRVYLLRQGELEQLTTDHSLVQELVDDGQLSEQEATVHPQRHVLTRALGVDSEVSVDALQVLPLRGDRLLLCSDGLSRELSDGQVAGILRRLADPEDAAHELVAAAKIQGGNDNITVVIVDVVDDADLPRAASAALEATAGLRAPTPLPSLARDDDEAGKGALSAPTPPPRVGRPKPRPAATVPQTRALTVRVVGFVVLIVALVGAAAAAVAWYARDSYFVGVRDGTVTVYRGRPGGLLWFQPTVAHRTAVHLADVPASSVSDLRSGKEEPSVAQALAYVGRLQEAQAQLTTTTTTTTTSTPGSVTTTTLAHP